MATEYIVWQGHDTPEGIDPLNPPARLEYWDKYGPDWWEREGQAPLNEKAFYRVKKGTELRQWLCKTQIDTWISHPSTCKPANAVEPWGDPIYV